LTEIAAGITADAADDLAFSVAMLLEGASCAAQIYSGQQSANVLVKAAEAVVEAYCAG
jgi:hypothetical protein